MIKIKSSKIIKNFEKGPIRRSLFDNGAVTLFHHVKGVSSGVVNLYFLAGSIFETEEEYGIAHVIEHMLFKEGGKTELIKELEFHGAEINAYTSKEYICFEMHALSSKLEEFLPKFLQLFLNPLFDINELTLEKNVVVQELKEDKDDHEVNGLEYIFKNNFDAKLGHSIGGSVSSVKKFKKETLEKYYQRFLTPNRMILSVASGKKLDSLETILQREMLPVKTKVKAPFRLGQSDKIGKLNHFKNHLSRKMENNILMFSFNGVSLQSRYFYELLVLDELLFAGLSSKLFTLLREELGLVYGLGSAINSFVKTGNYIMIFNTSPKNTLLVKNEVLGLLDYYCENLFDAVEVKGIIERIKNSWQMSFDSAIERCEYIAMEEIYGTYNYSIEKMNQEISQVSNKSINKFMKKIFRNEFSELVLGSK